MLDTLNHTKTVEDREIFLTELYKGAFPLVATYISRSQGTFEQAKDVFHDALVIYYEKVVLEGTPIEKGSKAYLLGIARHLWIRQSQIQRTSLDGYEDRLPDIKDAFPAENKLLRFLKVAGEKCMSMLKAFYYDRQSLEEISREYGYTSTRSATVQKYKCLEKLRDQVKEKSLVYEDFLE
ncbi:sigma-70 region 2 domain protein [Fulvivirga imtechensis AK7]|uniref:Sigma-70 region 2 domain protein n=1 Tax=Fulvivirga imtechensis AK7 TaxID=1237149 RepID=L8JRP6_9BACT|nr:sigma-70 family RNA polymerase sigma factor [Fulvivirga imtechensis]ELR70154.1 sigma-70 region 2 domain protein [Fulvivirga imtechensis AK7]